MRGVVSQANIKMAVWWCHISFIVLAILSLSDCQYGNNSTLNCTYIDWDDVNTTNYTELDDVFEKCLSRVSQFEECPDPTVCVNTGSDNENLGLAFGLTIAAGLATTLGSLVPFIPCVRRSDTKYLAASLGLAAGVMLYVSFTEIFIKSQDQFCCISVTHYNLLTTSCFFVGILITVGLDALVKLLEKIDCGCCKCRSTCYVTRGSQDIVVLSSTSSNHSCNPVSIVSPIATGNGGVVQFEASSIDQMNPQTDNEGNNLAAHSINEEESPSLHNRADFMTSDLDNDRMAYTPNIDRSSISAASNTVSTTTNNLGMVGYGLGGL